jgi:hypothetical protein
MGIGAAGAAATDATDATVADVFLGCAADVVAFGTIVGIVVVFALTGNVVTGRFIVDGITVVATTI